MFIKFFIIAMHLHRITSYLQNFFYRYLVRTIILLEFKLIVYLIRSLFLGPEQKLLNYIYV